MRREVAGPNFPPTPSTRAIRLRRSRCQRPRTATALPTPGRWTPTPSRSCRAPS